MKSTLRQKKRDVQPMSLAVTNKLYVDLEVESKIRQYLEPDRQELINKYVTTVHGDTSARTNNKLCVRTRAVPPVGCSGKGDARHSDALHY